VRDQSTTHLIETTPEAGVVEKTASFIRITPEDLPLKV
jgi:hypothetical protein